MSASVPDDHATLLGPSYAIERELAGGGMSRVFLANERQFGRRVVVKVLADALREGLSADRFTREITLAARLQHPNIVPLLAAGLTSAGAPYYTMPFVDGASLRERLRQGPVPLSEAVALLRDTARALAYAHGQGLVHRDVKPENILLSQGAAVVTDFGIAKAVSESRLTDGATTLTQVGNAIGTPAYMAPEQAAGDAVDARADLYAWGVVAYELLSGAHPFANKTTGQALIAAHIAEPPAPLPHTIPPDLAALVLRCLAKSPADRPASAEVIVAALDGARAHPLGARSEPIVRSRRPVWIPIIAIVALLAGAGLWWGVRARTSGTGTAATAPIRIAVLPFEHEGPADQEIFAAGLTDALTARLGTLPTLAVIDRRSSAQYRGTTKSAKVIGEELDVRYLLEGVVRWARTADGAWRAQVVPTLVDVTSGTTKWTGEPEVMTPTDPFTAQGEIARRVVDALALSIAPDERQRLTIPLTRNPEAFAAFTRGRALMDEMGRAPPSLTLAERAGAQFRAAVMSDSTFGDAWAYLALSEGLRAFTLGSPPSEVARARAVFAQAFRIAPNHPVLLMLQAMLAGSRPERLGEARSLARRALEGAPNDAMVVTMGANVLEPDSILPALERVLRIDPRSPLPRWLAGRKYLDRRRWSDARRQADALLTLDSTDERGWVTLVNERWLQGDTIGMQRVLQNAVSRIPRPTNELLNFAPYAGGMLRQRYLAMSSKELGVTSPLDFIVKYHDSKMDGYLLLGDSVAARSQADSIRRYFAGTYQLPVDIVQWRAFVEALSGDRSRARRLVDSLNAILRTLPGEGTPGLRANIAGPAFAGTYALLGDTAAAMEVVRGLLATNTGWTARGLATYPKLRSLVPLPQFQLLIKAETR
jgi:serine/threonine-protein kinase